MNARLNICQAAYDAKLPPPVSETPQEVARAEWLYNAAERLIEFGLDVKVKVRGKRAKVVTIRDLALAIDEHVNNRLADCKVMEPSLGWLMLNINWKVRDKNSEEELLGHSGHVFGMRGEIAERLLAPLADDALQAQAEDADL